MTQRMSVTFDVPEGVLSGRSGSLLNGVFEGIDFGVGQWRWEIGSGSHAGNHLYFASDCGTARAFRFHPAPQQLISLRVFTGGRPGTLLLSDELGQTLVCWLRSGEPEVVTPDWPLPSTIVTVAFSGGWELGLEGVTYETVPETAIHGRLVLEGGEAGRGRLTTAEGHALLRKLMERHSM